MIFDQQVTFIYVEDLETSAIFYQDTLGLELVLDQGGCRIFKISADGFLGICRCNDKRPSSPAGIIITLVTQDVDGVYEKLKSKGVTFDNPPTKNPDYNIYHCFLNDPDGYKLEIQCFHDPAWPKPEHSGNMV